MKKIPLLLVLMILILTACTSQPSATPPPPSATSPQVEPTAYPVPESTATQEATAYPEPQKAEATTAEQKIEPTPYPDFAPTATPADPQDIVRELADKAVLALQSGNLQPLASMVHPSNGLRFSPYSFVRNEDLFFISAELPSLMDNPNQYVWGSYDGSGEPINLTFADYFARFVYDVDFANAPQVSINERLGMGNTIDNSAEFYPGAMVVEYYFPGIDDQYQGMDWRSLRFVFQDYNGRWVLVGIIHDEWTT